MNILALDNNPLNRELTEVYEQGLDAVKAYLRAKAAAQITLNEAKLILVGEGEVGKTCLMDALLGKEWQEHPSTHGIEIQQVKVADAESQKEITLNGWDFGGQRQQFSVWLKKWSKKNRSSLEKGPGNDFQQRIE